MHTAGMGQLPGFLRFFRKRARVRPEPPDGVRMATVKWYEHTEEMAGTGMAAIARKLPALISQAIRLAWTASRIDTAASIGLNLIAGIFTAFGLLATTGVLSALFPPRPTPGRGQAAPPSSPLLRVP